MHAHAQSLGVSNQPYARAVNSHLKKTPLPGFEPTTSGTKLVQYQLSYPALVIN